jgi:hypothetical protein
VDYDEFLALMQCKRSQELADLHETLPTVAEAEVNLGESITPAAVAAAAAE